MNQSLIERRAFLKSSRRQAARVHDKDATSRVIRPRIRPGDRHRLAIDVAREHAASERALHVVLTK